MTLTEIRNLQRSEWPDQEGGRLSESELFRAYGYRTDERFGDDFLSAPSYTYPTGTSGAIDSPRRRSPASPRWAASLILEGRD